jgi:hypothetical protein
MWLAAEKLNGDDHTMPEHEHEHERFRSRYRP